MQNTALTSTYQEVAAQREFVTKVYGWMSVALAITAITAMVTASSPSILNAIVASRGVFIGLLLGELALVMALSWAIGRISAAAATAMFVLYSALNGLTLSFIFLVYTQASVASTFFITAGTFGALCLYGHVTKRDLTSVGNLCFMALIGLILASLVNMFFQNEMIYWLTTYAGILIFVGLTAYDAQKINLMSYGILGQSGQAVQKVAVLGALALYLDFINLFLLLLRLFGRRR